MRVQKIIFIFLLPLIISCGNDNSARQAAEVDVYIVKGDTVSLFRDYIGQLYGKMDIVIPARVEGFLEGIHFKEGSVVKKGTLLYTIERQPYEAEVASQLSKLAEAETMLAKARSDLDRMVPLAEQKAVSESQLDAARAQYEAAQASVEAAKAGVRAARIKLSYTKIYTPISGIIGRTQAQVGDFVGREKLNLNTVSRTDTMLVRFFITEKEYIYLARAFKNNDEPKEQEKVELKLLLADGSAYGHYGTVDFIDRNIDPATGTILVQASFPNPDGMLRPGQFAKVRIKTETINDAVLIPQRCVIELQGKFSVFTVNDSDIVRKREIDAGDKINNFWLVNKGLEIGDKVVFQGLQRIASGMTVKPIPAEVKKIDRNIQ